MNMLGWLSAVALVATPTLAQAADSGPAPCLKPAEFAALSAYALPSAIRGAGLRCDPVLGKDAFLPGNGTKLAARYDAAKSAAWPVAKAAFLKSGIIGDPDAAQMFRTMPDSTLQPLVDTMITGMVQQKLPTDRCAAVDRLLALLSPLPAQSTGEAIAIAIGLGASGGKARIGWVAVCPA